METALLFANVSIDLDFDEGAVPLMYMYKGFIFLDMGNDKVTFVPISPEDKEDLLCNPDHKIVKVTDKEVIEALDTLLDGKIAEEE